MKQKNMKPNINTLAANLRRIALALACGVTLGLGLVTTACTNDLSDDDILNPNPNVQALAIEVGAYPGYTPDGAGTRAAAALAPNENFTVNNTMWIVIMQSTKIEQILKATTTDGKTWNFVTDTNNAIALPTKLDETKEYTIIASASASITGCTINGFSYDAKVGLYDVLYGRYTIAANDAAAHKKLDFNTPNAETTPRLYHQFDRIRFTTSAQGKVVKLTASKSFKLPNSGTIDSDAISATAGTDNNVYFYGFWGLNTTFHLNDNNGNLLFEATVTLTSASFSNIPGKSYHFTN